MRLLPIDTIRFASLHAPFAILIAMVLVSKVRNRLLPNILTILLCLYSAYSLIASILISQILATKQRPGYLFVEKIRPYLRSQEVICSQDIQLPWYLVDNPVGKVSRDRQGEYLQWKGCKALVIRREKGQWVLLKPKEYGKDTKSSPK